MPRYTRNQLSTGVTSELMKISADGCEALKLEDIPLFQNTPTA